ncbi:MAG: sialate O-acetylesterase [Verrucomicrobia bacterium]|nr:sialate O-acetylesterase [Verrucomicrobiota bacterium]MDA0725460.1 sialate O-acetylesterase [Verrucomicrobiota bacterium]MDA1045745.1 sialate O-acetylesterase [Verrucomicrobiota bacterium]
MNRPALTISCLIGLFCTIGTSTQAKEIKVFILAGQSNMVGHGKVEQGRSPDYDKNDKETHREVKGGIGSLRHLATDPKTAPKYKHLLDAKGNWVVRDDTWIYSTATGGGNKDQQGKLTVGFGAGVWFGPEFAFGHVVGDALDEPVLIIKTSWGGHSLGVKFRSPSSGQPTYTKGKFKPEDVGSSYREMLKVIKEVCGNMETHFPELKGYKPKFAGFGWHQGWNDGTEEMTAEYEKNMANFIKDVRKDLKAKDLPFVIATSGMIGLKATGVRAKLCEIQMAMGDPKKHPEFAGTVASVETRSFKRETPSHFGYHWNHSGESHYLIGDAMGTAMINLLKEPK